MTVTPDNFANYAYSSVAGGTSGRGTALGASDTTLYLPTGDGAKMPSAVPFMVQLTNNGSTQELAKCTAISGDTLTLTRGQESTTARQWVVGSIVEAVTTAGNMSNIWTQLVALQPGAGVPFFNVKNYGAVGDGTTDDTTAIQNAITAAKNAGGQVYFPDAGPYAFSSTLALAGGAYPIALRGDGLFTTTLKWIGALNGTMVTIAGSTSATQGNALGDLRLDGNNSAGYGLHLTSAQYGQFGALAIVNTTICGLKLDALSSGSGTLNTLANHFGKLYLSPAAGTSGQQSVALWLDGSATSGADTNNNTFENVTLNAVQNYTTGLRLGFCDFNNFGMLNTFVSGTGAYGLLLDGSVSSGFPKNNYFVQANFASAPQVTGTVGNNWVQHLDMSDGASSIPTSGLFGLADNPNGEAGLVPFGVTPMVNSQASTINQLLTVTTGVNVVSVFGAQDGLYQANLYFRITGASNVTITATAFSADETANRSWTMEGSGSGALTLLSAASLAPGGYYCVPVVMRYASGGAQVPVIQVTASTASVVYVTASIVKVG